MDFEKVIEERFSVRQFENKRPDKEIIKKILSCAHKAPTGCNLQPQRILVMNTDESMAKLKECTKCHFDAPSAMLVCYNKNEGWTRGYDGAKSAPIDASIVATHIMLSAHNVGLGPCWVMHFDPIKIKKAYNIPDDTEPLALIVMGYPHKDAKPLDMHYQTRPMEEVVIYESF